MDGSITRRFAAVRQRPKAANAITTSALATPFVYTEPLIFDPAVLAPTPPDGVPDNLLLASTKDAPIKLTLALPDNVDFDDTIQLLLNGELVGEPVVITELVDSITIELSAEARASVPEGVVTINYIAVFVSGSGEHEYGPSNQTFIIDYTAPGLPFLGTLEFEEEVKQNGVTPEVLETDEEGREYLAASVPSYQGLAPGDVIIGIVNSQEEEVAIIVGDTDTNIELRFMREFIQDVGDGKLSFLYKVKDRAGNVSLPSAAVELAVLLKGAIDDLATPIVPAYDDDNEADPVGKLIDEADARADGGVEVQIPVNSAILAGDKIFVLWGSAEVGPVTVTNPSDDPVAVIGVPYAAISAEWSDASGGTDTRSPVEVNYRVVRDGIVAGTPAIPATVEVNLYQAGGVDPEPETPENENFVAPTLTSASDQENQIPPDDFDQDARVSVSFTLTDRTAAFAVGDIITVIYGGQSLDPYVIDEEPAADIYIVVPAETIGTVGSGNVNLAYRVARELANGGTNTSVSPTTMVMVSGKDELPGGGTLPAGSVPEAVGTDPSKPDRLLLGKLQGKDGTDFFINAYTNQKVGDKITVRMNLFRSFYATGHEADRQPTYPRDVSKVVTVVDAGNLVIVHFTEVELMRYDLPTQALHAHFLYTIEGVATPGRPVTSDVLLVDIDPRGD
ncbi:hypothetical protein [Xanthomonas sp. NCPPB 2632]|uniref:hypothetical protein n=1 Tax=Xanthomonas sp. NCPPB 2632 TaxID=3240912 RepID=UPI0035194A92